MWLHLTGVYSKPMSLFEMLSLIVRMYGLAKQNLLEAPLYFIILILGVVCGLTEQTSLEVLIFRT